MSPIVLLDLFRVLALSFPYPLGNYLADLTLKNPQCPKCLPHQQGAFQPGAQAEAFVVSFLDCEKYYTSKTILTRVQKTACLDEHVLSRNPKVGDTFFHQYLLMASTVFVIRLAKAT